MTTQYTWLVGLRSAQGFVAATFPPVAILWLTENISAPRRVAAIACISCDFLLSASLGQWFGAAFITSSLVPVMGIAALVYAVGGIIFSFLPSKAFESRQHPQSFLRDLTEIARQRDLLKIYLLTFFLFNSLLVFYSGVAGELRPLLLKYSIDPIWFRVVAIPGLMLSLLTPPVLHGSVACAWCGLAPFCLPRGMGYSFSL